jgi:L-amino acid N-acyltransferase YncA
MTAPRSATKADAAAIVTELIIRTPPSGYHALVAICCSEAVVSIALHESLGLSRVEQLREIGRKFDHWPNFYLQVLL